MFPALSRLSRWFDSPRKWAWWVLLLIVFTVVYFLVLDRFTPSTNDASVRNWVTDVTAVVPGRVVAVAVADNQQVPRGTPLFAVDPEPYQIALSRASAEVLLAGAELSTLRDEVAGSDAALQAQQATHAVAEQHLQRFRQLAAQGFVSADELDRIEARAARARADWQQAQQQLAARKAGLGDTPGGNARLMAARAGLEQALWNLNHTLILAPRDGRVTNLRLQPGAWAGTGQTALTLVASSRPWVSANFTENALSRVQPGQRVMVSFNGQPGGVWSGRVKSIAWGVDPGEPEAPSGLPRVEKTHNWVRLSQRFPTHIELEGNIPEALRVGATAIVTIHATNNPLLVALGSINHWLRAQWQYLY